MTDKCENIKASLEGLLGKALSDKAKLVAILEACRITERDEIERLLECKPSTLREARRTLKLAQQAPEIQRQESSAAGNPAPEIQRTAGNPAQAPEIQRQNSSDRQKSSVGTVHAFARRAKESPSEINITQSVSQSHASEREAEPAGWQDLKSSFNGSTEAMLADVQAFMGPIANRTDAIKWLSGTLSAYGQQRTAQAWTIITAKRAQGEIVANPLPLWAKTAGGMKPSAGTPKPFKPSRW